MKNYHNIFFNPVDYGYCCPIEHLINILGAYMLIYADLYFTLLKFSALVNTKWLKSHSSSIKYEELVQMFLPSCGVRILFYQRAFAVFLGEFWSSYTNFYFTSLRFIVLVITKYKKKDSSSINMNNYKNCCHPYCRVWILLSHMDSDICFCDNIGLDIPISTSHDSYSVS